MDNFRLRRNGTRWMAEARGQVFDYQLLEKSGKEILRDMELEFVQQCIDAGCKQPDEVVTEVQLGLTGEHTVYMCGFVVKVRDKHGLSAEN